VSAYRHIVLFRFHHSATPADEQRAVELLDDLRHHPGILSWRLAWSDDSRKGRVLVEDVLFADRSAYAAWRETPAHDRAGAFLAGVSDWLVGDLPA
jgi:hypothetical protein